MRGKTAACLLPFDQACLLPTTQAWCCQGKRSGLTAPGGVVYFLMPDCKTLWLHRSPLAFSLLCQGLDIEVLPLFICLQIGRGWLLPGQPLWGRWLVPVLTIQWTWGLRWWHWHTILLRRIQQRRT